MYPWTNTHRWSAVDDTSDIVKFSGATSRAPREISSKVVKQSKVGKVARVAVRPNSAHGAIGDKGFRRLLRFLRVLLSCTAYKKIRISDELFVGWNSVSDI